MLTSKEAEAGSGIHLLLSSLPDGCGNVFPFDTLKGNIFSLESPGEWKEIRVTASEQAYFHSKPDASSQLKTFVVRGDVLRIHKRQTGWVYAECAGEKTIRGWIQEADLYNCINELTAALGTALITAGQGNKST